MKHFLLISAVGFAMCLFAGCQSLTKSKSSQDTPVGSTYGDTVDIQKDIHDSMILK